MESVLGVFSNFIPSAKIDEAFAAYMALPKEDESDYDADRYLTTVRDENGVELVKLLSRTVRNMFDGEAVDDRSFAMTVALKEILGWCNWLNAEGSVPGPAPAFQPTTAPR